MKVDVLILAGAKTNEELQQLANTEYEALIEIANLSMVEYVIRAVKKSALVDKIIVVGPKEELKAQIKENVDLIVQSGDSLIDNVKKGIEVIDNNKQVLLMTSDIPLINTEVINQFITSCEDIDEEIDIYYPIISKEKCIAKYPDIARTYVKLVEGTFTGGNIVLINPLVLREAVGFIEKVFMWRKKPWKLSRLFGFKFIIKLFLGSLSIVNLEKRLTELIGFKGKAVITELCELGFDVDKASDLKLMREKFQGKEE